VVEESKPSGCVVGESEPSDTHTEVADEAGLARLLLCQPSRRRLSRLRDEGDLCLRQAWLSKVEVAIDLGLP
jgi:hypothetical protein